MNEIILEAKNLYKRFDQGRTPAVEEVSLKLEKGKIYALVGPSGCGKTTLMHCLGNLESVDSGSIFYAGKPAESIRSWAAFCRDFLGFVFQFHYLLPTLTLQENVEMALQLSKRFSTGRSKRARELLRIVGLEHKAASFAEAVSGGERQRAAIARAFANGPELILADEPTGNVDSQTGGMILEYMRHYVRTEKKSILIATHDPDVEAIADEIITMRDGRLTGWAQKIP